MDGWKDKRGLKRQINENIDKKMSRLCILIYIYLPTRAWLHSSVLLSTPKGRSNQVDLLDARRRFGQSFRHLKDGVLKAKEKEID